MAKTPSKLIDFDAFKTTHAPFTDMQGLVNQLRKLLTVWSWGATQWTAMNSHCLRFKVHGHHHRGHVYLAVNGSDLFDIHLTTSRGTVKHVFTDIFIDDLVGTIDEAVERIPAYVN